jgi:tRNA modification GTPase
MFDLNTTIVAPATGTSTAAIGIIRISGPETFTCLRSIFPALKGGQKPKRGVQYGHIYDTEGLPIDEVVVTFFPGPHSYTKQDTAEISCHGSSYIIQRIISLLCQSGCQLAHPGEFTYRGRMDLAQAEAVTDLITSTTQAQHQIAFGQLKGDVSEDIKVLRQKLIDFASLIELELDFGEEDVEFADRTQLNDLINNTIDHIDGLIASFELGNAIKEGVPIAIIGEPNAGKSTLLNALLKEDRAIVSDIPGTTRDSIEEVINIDGILFRMIDTAGIRETSDMVEAEGVQRALNKMEIARIVIFIVDASATSPLEVERLSKQFNIQSEKSILVLNKADLVPAIRVSDYSFEGPVVRMSAKHAENMNELESVLYKMIENDRLNTDQTILSNLRHKDAFQRAMQDLIRVKDGLQDGLSGDLIAMDIRQALHHIGMITGEISADDLLGNIFSRFCIGK